VNRDLRFEVAERVRADGSIETALDVAAVRAAVRKMAEAEVKSIAVCCLYGFLTPDHEQQILDIIAEEHPESFRSASHAVAPEFREYERMSTTVVNAYLGPVMERYIQRLKQRLAELGVAVAPQLTQSNGGVIGFDAAASLPVRTVLSGPSTGVVAAQAIGRMAGFNNVITFDVGGTSSDVALLRNGDIIRLDLEARRIDMLVDEDELQRRREAWVKPAEKFGRGYGWMFSRHVAQADTGCDFDFLETGFGPTPGEPDIY